MDECARADVPDAYDEVADPETATILVALRALRERCGRINLSTGVGAPSSVIDAEKRAGPRPFARRGEFTAGRSAAQAALTAAGLVGASIDGDEHGVPVFPDGFVGSISHKHGRAIAAVVGPSDVLGVGIDLEFDENHDEESVRAAVVTPFERPNITTLQAAENALLSPGTLALAAKEALYKAVFPLKRTVFDLDDADIAFMPAERSFCAVRFPGDEELAVEGSYELQGRWIVVVAFASAR